MRPAERNPFGRTGIAEPLTHHYRRRRLIRMTGDQLHLGLRQRAQPGHQIGWVGHCGQFGGQPIGRRAHCHHVTPGGGNTHRGDAQQQTASGVRTTGTRSQAGIDDVGCLVQPVPGEKGECQRDIGAQRLWLGRPTAAVDRGPDRGGPAVCLPQPAMQCIQHRQVRTGAHHRQAQPELYGLGLRLDEVSCCAGQITGPGAADAEIVQAEHPILPGRRHQPPRRRVQQREQPGRRLDQRRRTDQSVVG